MTLKTIYIARHGYRSNWLPPPHPPNPTGIDSDPALAPHGVEQAKELAGYLGSLPKDEQPQFILTSPFYRCVETSQPIAQTLKAPIALERGIGEWYKKSRGVVPEPANYDVLKKFFPELGNAELWNRDETVGVIPNKDGETEDEIYQRTLSFWKKLIPTFEAKFPEIDTIIMVTHAATKIALGSSLLGVPSVFDPIDSNNTLLRAGACSLDKYVLEGDRWTIKMNGNCDFLTQGEEMNWNFHWKFEAGSDEDIKARKEEEKKKKLELQGALQDGEMPPVTDIAYGLEKPSDDNYEHIYVTMDIPSYGKSDLSQFENISDEIIQKSHSNKDHISTSARQHYIPTSSHIQITDLNDSHPLLKLTNDKVNVEGESISLIDGKVYQTDWLKLVGTEMVFDEYGQLIGCVREHLRCNENVKITPKKDDSTESMEVQENDATSSTKDERTAFFKKAINAAKKNESNAPK